MYSYVEMPKSRATKKGTTAQHSLTDWDRVDRMPDEDIDFSDLPEIPPERFAQALVRKSWKPVVAPGGPPCCVSENPRPRVRSFGRNS